MKTLIKSVLLFTLVTLNFFFLLSCGKKGPLTLNPIIHPEKISKISVSQVGDNLKFAWEFPVFLKDKKTKFDIHKITRVFFYYSNKPVTSNSIQKKGRLLKKVGLNKIRSKNNKYIFSYPRISSKFLNKKIYTAMYYKYRKIISNMTAIKEITILDPVKPVEKLKITNENKVIKLDWERKNSDAKKKTVQILGYNIFRQVLKSGEEINLSFQKINKDIILDEHYEDSDTGFSGFYKYYVSVVLTNSNISEKSNIVEVNVNDIFPPEIPQNIIIFKSSDGLMISWEAVKDKDLAHYTLYRKEKSESDFKILISKIENNNFLDKNIKKGKVYFYCVTSTDKNGNESDNSKTSSEKL